MPYRHLTQKESYSYLSSGHVLYNAPGLTAFPVRLAAEIAVRCFAILKAQGHKGPYTLYDPCCGGGYLLSTIGFLYGNLLERIIASDVSSTPLMTAQKNLSLLHEEGLERRQAELIDLFKKYNKESHKNALMSVEILRKIIISRNHKISIECFQANIMNLKSHTFFPDIVITDLPYGNLTHFTDMPQASVPQFFANITHYRKGNLPLLVIIANKNQKLVPEGFKKTEHFILGKRKINIFSPNNKCINFI